MKKTNSIFIVILKFSTNKSRAGEFMEGHNEWIKRGFKDGVFLIVGSLKHNLGGGILAHNVSLLDIQDRVKKDPFVEENIVMSEILEINLSKVDDKLDFLFS